MHSILRSAGVGNLFLRQRNFSFPFTLFNAFKAKGSPGKVSSKTELRYVTCKCCFIFIFLYFRFSFLALLILRLLAKRIGLVLSSPKPQSVCLIYFPRTSYTHFQNPCLVFFQFLRHFHFGTWDMNHRHIKTDLILQPEAYHWHKQGTTMVLK